MTDRVTVYTNQVPYEADILKSNKNPYVGVGRLSSAILGTSDLVNGLSCVPNSPADLSVNVNPGEIYSLQVTDATAYGVLPIDTRPLYKQGILLDITNFPTPAPSTSGFSINYLIQAKFLEQDTDIVSRPYFNAADPSAPIFNSAAATRQDSCVVSIKAGIAATTGTQVTPSPDVGNMGLWVITVANGQTTVTSGNITQYSAASIITERLGDKISLATGDARYARIAQVQYYSGIVNGASSIAQRQTTTIVNNTRQFGLVDAIGCTVSATTVTGGTLTQETGNSYSSSGRAAKFSNLSTTGTTTIKMDSRIEALDSINYRNSNASFSCYVQHDFGSAINFTITINKATVANNFTSVTNIATSSAISVPTGIPTQLKFENVAMGDCSNGIEIIVSCVSGGLTTKNLTITDRQLNLGSTIIAFVPKSISTELEACLRRYEKSYPDGVAAGTVTTVGEAISATGYNGATFSFYTSIPFKCTKVVTPTLTIWSPSGTINRVQDGISGLYTPTVATFNNSFLIDNISPLPTGQTLIRFQWQAAADL